MADTTTSPNMNLPVPNVSVAPGPDWATDLNACLSAIDSHTHAASQGVQITPDGLDINADLPIGSNNVTEVKTVNFTAQSGVLSGASDLGCLYVASQDLYYNDESGNHVRITQSGSVTGSAGTITGLPSGTASAAYSAGTFTFQSATNTPATMAVGPLVVGRNAAASKTVTITPDVAQAGNYGLTLPAALPASSAYLTVDNSGNITTVLASLLIGGTFSPTVTFVPSTTGNLVFTPSVSSWTYIRIGAAVQVGGAVTISSITGSTSDTYSINATLPVATASFTPCGMHQNSINGGAYVNTPALANSSTTVVIKASQAFSAGDTYIYFINYMYQVS